MEKSAKIYVAGHHGLVGSAIWKNLQEKGYTHLIGRSHKELDLLDGVAVKRFWRPLMLGGLWQTVSIGQILSIKTCKYSRMSSVKVSDME